MSKNIKSEGNPSNRARSLSDRADDAPGLSALRELGCKLACRATGQKVYWPSPIFSRLAVDIPDSAKLTPTLDKLRRLASVSVIEPQAQGTQSGSEVLGSGADRSLDDGLTIQPVFVDEPLAFESLMHAEQIELQFLPKRNGSNHSHNAAFYPADRWMPTLPSDLTDVEKMAKRIDLIRSSSDQPTVVVGGAIPAGRVYDDVRFLIDCGVDYVNVLAHVVAGLRPAKSWTLQPIDHVVEQALAAIDKSGVSHIPLLVCSPIDSVQEAIRLLSLGVDAFSIDSWLVDQQAAMPNSNQSSQDLGSFMGSYTKPAAPTANEGWVWASQAFLKDLNSLRRLFEI